MSETVALNKKRQSKFARKVSKIKSKVQKGDIVVKETVVRPVKPGQERGVVYVGHIPHGFFEEEMKEYFGQFGVVTRVRVCRSYKSGKSKGYGFVQFLHPEVAEVAAESMDNYVMFKRRLEVKSIKAEKQHPHLFNGWPWAEKNTPYTSKIKELTRSRNRNLSDAEHDLTTRRRLKKMNGTLKKLAALGIEHRFQPIDTSDDVDGTTRLVPDSPAESKKRKAAKKSSPDSPKPVEGRGRLMRKVAEIKPAVSRGIKKQKERLVEKKKQLKTKFSGEKLKKATMSILNNSSLVSKKKKTMRKK